ncbi:MAG: tRNA 2-thiouridine(34) synthase MnmA [Magnetococcus sp. YQC-3]
MINTSLPKKRVAVAMSGGVDSSVAAASLLAQGYEVIGLTMRLWSGGEGARGRRTCCASEDLYDARRVAQTLNIPFFVVDLEAQFRAAVVADFVETYAAGRTPNPCIRCNQHLKFQHLLHKAQELQAEFLATGHYALWREGVQGPQLWRGADRLKDQSYFLFTITPEQLRYLRFPLGEMRKEETRLLAERFGLHLARKGESQDLCFVPDGDNAAFLAREGAALFRPGPIVDLAGRLLGRHAGLGGYTIGQRRGLGIAAAHPLYVVAIETAGNRLVVGPEEALWQQRLRVGEINWLGDSPLTAPQRIQARIRYAAEPQPGLLQPLGGGEADLLFDAPQRAIAPGQAAVFYEGERVLGGGWIRGGSL